MAKMGFAPYCGNAYFSSWKLAQKFPSSFLNKIHEYHAY